jgi:glucose/arabinose dehydrogenase
LFSYSESCSRQHKYPTQTEEKYVSIAMFRLLLTAVLLATNLSSCYVLQPSDGGGQTAFNPPRTINPSDIAVPAGYRIELVARDFTFPTGVAIDESGGAYVTEAGYSYGEIFTLPRLIKVAADGSKTVVATGAMNGPWNGITYANGAFYVAEGGELQGGRILRITKNGDITVLVSGLPSLGDHHTNGPAIGPDGYLYFGQGTATNSGVVGRDNYKFGWLKRYPTFNDTPCQDIALTGRNFVTDNVFDPSNSAQVVTGPYSPYGVPVKPGQVMPGKMPCNGAIMRVPLSGGKPELIAWGLRNPYGLAFSPDGKLFVTENAYDVRGSRPVWGTGDVVWEIKPGLWYGWPDFSAGRPLTEEVFRPPGKSQPLPLLAKYPNPPPEPAMTLGVHASVNGIDFSRNPAFGHVGDAFLAVFGDMAPEVGKVMDPVGFKVLRVNLATKEIRDFAVNRAEVNAPASKLKSGGLERPIDVQFDPSGKALYIADFGVMTMDKGGAEPRPETGVIWRVVKEGA